MLKILTIGALIATASVIALPAHACDRHMGGGYGGFGEYNWKPYNPLVTTEDPALMDQNMEQTSLMTPVPTKKVRPSFSNAADRAAILAKTRLAKKAKDQKDEKSEDAVLKKAALKLDANR